MLAVAEGMVLMLEMSLQCCSWMEAEWASISCVMIASQDAHYSDDVFAHDGPDFRQQHRRRLQHLLDLQISNASAYSGVAFEGVEERWELR